MRRGAERRETEPESEREREREMERACGLQNHRVVLSSLYNVSKDIEQPEQVLRLHALLPGDGARLPSPPVTFCFGARCSHGQKANKLR